MNTITDLYNYYTALYREDRSDAVRTNYRYNFNKHILQYIGDRDISTVTFTEFQTLLNNMKGMSQTAIRSVVGDLKLIIRHSYIDGYICRDFAPYLASSQIHER